MKPRRKPAVVLKGTPCQVFLCDENNQRYDAVLLTDYYSARKVGREMPRFRLSDGRVVDGCECWWIPTEQAEAIEAKLTRARAAKGAGMKRKTRKPIRKPAPKPVTAWFPVGDNGIPWVAWANTSRHPLIQDLHLNFAGWKAHGTIRQFTLVPVKPKRKAKP